MSTAALLLPLGFSSSPPRAALDRPNVVMLFVDDLGYGDVGFNGHPTTNTPNIDKLAWNGKVLTTWYSGCPVCSCSRASLMTGRQWSRMGIPGVFGPTVDSGLPLNETTSDPLQRVVQEAFLPALTLPLRYDWGAAALKLLARILLGEAPAAARLRGWRASSRASSCTPCPWSRITAWASGARTCAA